MQNKDVIKHSSAIHTSGTLSLLERKFSNVLLHNAYDNLLLQPQHSINIYALCEVAGFNSKDISQAKEALRNLTKISVEWDILKSDGSTKWGVSNFLSSAEIDNGICTYEYSGSLAKQLANPEIYGRINLEVQKNFTSGYALTIYEICSSYKGLLLKRKTSYSKWMDLETFKTLVGVSESKYYDAFKELNRKIIKPSVQEINGTLKKFAGTDIFIAPEYKRTGRKVSDIRFKIELNPQMSLPIDNDENEALRKTPAYGRLLEYGFGDKGALYAIQSNSIEYVEEKLSLVDEAERRGEIKSSPSGYLIKAIDEDYQPPKKITQARNQQKEAAKALEAQDAARKEKADKNAKEKAKKLREQFINGLSDAENDALFEKLKKDIPATISKNIKDLKHPALAAAINEIIN